MTKMAHLSPYDLYRAHSLNTADFSRYHTEASLTFVPTNAGANNLDEIKKFYTKYWAKDEAEFVKTKKIVRVTYGNESVVEEAIVEITIKEGKGMEDRYMWLCPGLKLITPGDEVKIQVPWVTSITFSLDTGLITSKRIYWDQASVLKQLGYLFSVAPKAGMFGFHPNFTTPVLGIEQVERLENSAEVLPNLMALRIEEKPMPSRTGSRTSVSGIITGAMEPEPLKTSTKIDYEFGAANRQSHVLDDTELPPNGFSGKQINKKRYEGSDIFSVGSDEPTQRLSTRILRPGGTGGVSSIVNSQAEVDSGKTASEAGHDNAAVNRQSHVMEDGDFALNGFSGRQINQKRYETSDIFNAPIEPIQRLSTRILRPGGTGGTSSIINNVNFESHREAVKANHDHATANRESHFMEEGEQMPSITGKQINQKRYETNDIFGSEPESSQRLSTRILRPGGTGGQSSFDYMQVERPPSGTQRKHFSSRETNSTFEPSEKPLPKKSSPEFETHIGQSDAEIHPPTKKPNPMLEATAGKHGSEVERPIKKANPALETTLDKPLPPPVAKPQFELQSHLAPNPEGGLLPTSSTDEPVAPNPTKYVSRNLNSHVFPTDPSSTSSVDPAFVPEDQPAISRRSSKDSYRTNRSSFSLSTGSDFEYPNRPSTKVSEYDDKKKSSVILGDDGGEVGIVPKQVAKTISDLKERSERSRAPPGGRSSISFF